MLPADLPAEYAPVMVAACSDALPEGRCALAAELPESAPPQAVALVLWQGQQLLEVTVRVGQGDGKWLTRNLTFAASDSMSDRFTTVGLTAATLVGDTLSKPAPPAVTAPPVDAPPPAPSGPKAPKRESLFGAQVGALTGPSWSGAGWQRGGWLSFSARWPGMPFVAHAFGSYAVSMGPSVGEQELSSTWATAGLGAGVRGEVRSLAASAALEVGLRRVEATLGDRSADDWEAPVRLRGMLAFPAEGRVAITGGGLLRLPPGQAEASETHATTALSAEVLLGLEVRL